MSLTDLPETAGNKYYEYYMPGLGTPFPEIMDLDFTMGGLAFASHGEDRINWGLLCIIDALKKDRWRELLRSRFLVSPPRGIRLSLPECLIYRQKQVNIRANITITG